MKIIGITGGIGSGKSTICKLFKTLGIPVFDSDAEAKKLYTSKIVREEIIKIFGTESYFDELHVNYKYISNLAFNDSKILQGLNEIIHPKLQNIFEEWCHSNKHQKYVLKEAAILIESGTYKQCNEIIVVTSPIEMKVENVMKRNGISSEEVMKRINAQTSDSEKLNYANYEIKNDEKSLVIPQVLAIHQKIISNN